MDIQSITLENGEIFEIEKGDKCLAWNDGESCINVYQRCEVTFITEYSGVYICDHGHGTLNSFDHISQIPKIKFKVGNKVREIETGDVYIIDRPAHHNPGNYLVKTQGLDYIFFHEDELELYTHPKMIDLPKGIEFIEATTNSIGILFNNHKQLLNVRRNGLYEVRCSNHLEVKLHKPDYCLIESTREECMVNGVIFVTMSEVNYTVDKAKENLVHWKIGLVEPRCVGIDNDEKSIRQSYMVNCNSIEFYKLVKRSEVEK